MNPNHSDHQNSENDPDWDRQSVDEIWLDSLLHHVHHEDSAATESRLNALRESIQHKTPVAIASPRRLRPYISYLLAASLLVGLGLVFSQAFRVGTDAAALAAVSKSMSASVGYREYRLRILGRRGRFANQEIVARLYLDPEDRFVMMHPGWLGFGQTAIGGDRSHRWIVPRVGPVLVGGEELLGKWLAKKEIASPYLHVQTILERMKRAYDLDMLPDESLPGLDANGGLIEGQVFTCQRIHGRRVASNESLPKEIDLWADRDNGVARRLSLEWDAKNATGLPRRWTLDLTDPAGGDTVRSAEWYQYASHMESGRRVVSIGSQRDLDAIQPSSSEEGQE